MNHSRLLPLSGVEKFLDFLVSLLPRYCEVPQLVLRDGISSLDESSDKFLIERPESYIQLNFSKEPKTLLRSWLYLQCYIIRPNGDRFSRIEINGVGTFVPSNLRGTVREVLHYSGELEFGRLYPASSTGYIRFGIVKLERITKIEAVLRMFWRCLGDIYRLRKKPALLKNDLRIERCFLDLKDAYSRSASLRRSRGSGDAAYAEWFREYFSMNKNRVNLFKRLSECLPSLLISIVIPIFKPNFEWLGAAISSVTNQIYKEFQLVLVDDGNQDSELDTFLAGYWQYDCRICIVKRHKNGHISAALNSGLSVCEGVYVGFLDQDDILTEDALYWVAAAITDNPSAEYLYTDEDKIATSGELFSPYCKPNFDYRLLLSSNYLCHFSVVKKSAIYELSGFSSDVVGAQDWDLALRVYDLFGGDVFFHIPRILYHWRMHANSTSSDLQVKPYVIDSSKEVLRRHHRRRSIEAEILFDSAYGVYDVVCNIYSKPLVSIIIPTRNGLEYLKKCIESVFSNASYGCFEVIVVDNGSDDNELLDYLGKISYFNGVKVLRIDCPFNFSYLNNCAVDVSNGQIIGLLNVDTEVITSDWLYRLVALAVQEDVGAVGAKLLYPDYSVQHGGIILGVGGRAGHAHRHFSNVDSGYHGKLQTIHSVSAVTGACLFVRKKLFIEVGGLDEKSFAVDFNDVDFCLKLRRLGYHNVVDPRVILIHHESVIRGVADNEEKRSRLTKEMNSFDRKWQDYIVDDPFYSPLLSQDFGDFSLAWPPRVGSY